MSFCLKNEQKEHLRIVREIPTEDVVDLCKSAFEYLTIGPNTAKYDQLAKKYCYTSEKIQASIEALIMLLIDATKAKATDISDFENLRKDGFSPDVIAIFIQFVNSKRLLIEGSIKTANLRAYRLINLEWRLDVRIASRCLLKQSTVFVIMKLNLHKEPKNENRDLINLEKNKPVHSDEIANRKDVLVQTDVNSLVHIISVLEEALLESRSRRVRNIADAIH